MDFAAADNIIACSSGQFANVAISKIRLGGKLDLTQLNPFFSIDLTRIKPRRAYYANLLDGDKIIDDVVLLYFKGPNSFSGEDIIELDVHGNLLNIKLILELFVKNAGFRHAGPGEFSYRALKNKKLTINQVEGLDLLLNATSIYSLGHGRSLISGKIRADFNKLYQCYLDHKSALELNIDFLEDMGEEHARAEFDRTLNALDKTVSELHKHVANNASSILDPQIALIGEPNAGKSTFFNHLLADDRSIVSNIPGTTRDFVTENIVLGNIVFKLVDTAGLRESNDPIEKIGVERSVKVASESFANILVINPFSFELKNYQKLPQLPLDLVLFTHSDLSNFSSEMQKVRAQLSSVIGPIEPLSSGPIGANYFEEAGPIEPAGPMGAKSESGSIGARPIFYLSSGFESAEALTSLEFYLLAKHSHLLKNEPFLVKRHGELVESIYQELRNYKDLSIYESDISIVSSELQRLGDCISELIGIVSPDDVLQNIFSNFCIGK